MTRMPLIELDEASGTAQELLTQVKKGMGAVPNMTKAMANSPATLKGYLALSGALAGGVLGRKTQERLALNLAQTNGCDYCLSAHTFTAPRVGLSEQDVLDARRGTSADAKSDAILKFAAAVLESRGAVSEQDITDLRAAGVSDEEMGEIVANIALNVFTNFFNRAADVDIDFPVVDASTVTVS
jgi:uncharacterized peroxidase-related enzyme